MLKSRYFCSWTCKSAWQLCPASWWGCQPPCGHPLEPWSPSQLSGQIGTDVLHKYYVNKKLADLGFSPEVWHGPVIGVLLWNGQSETSDWESSGRLAKSFHAGVQVTWGNYMEIGSDSGARLLAAFDFGEVVVPEPNVRLQLRESSLFLSSFCPFPFPIYRISCLSSSSFGYICSTVWILEEIFFDSHLGAVPHLPKFWVYSDASNVILFSSYKRGRGRVVLDIVKVPCKRLYIIQMCHKKGKQKKE